MLNLLKSLRSAPRRAKPPASELWRIDLGPVDEPMMNGHAERMSFSTTEPTLALARRSTVRVLGLPLPSQ